MIKLPIFAVVRETYAFVWRERRLFWTLAVPGIIVISLVSVLQKWAEWDRAGRPENISDLLHTAWPSSRAFGQGSGASAADDSVVLLLALLVTLLIDIIVSLLYAVAWHRAYLIPGEPLSAASTYRWTRRQTNFVLKYLRLLWIVGPLLIVGPLVFRQAFPVLVETLNSEAPEKIGWVVFAEVLMSLGVIALGTYLLTRFALILPGAAVDHSPTLRRSWNLSRGNFWRLFWSGVLVGLPPTLLSKLETGATLLLWGAGLGGSLSAALLFSLFEQFFVFISLALGVSVLSISYRRLTAAA